MQDTETDDKSNKGRAVMKAVKKENQKSKIQNMKKLKQEEHEDRTGKLNRWTDRA